MRPLLPAPPSLVTAGQFNFGTFDTAIPSLNALEADIKPELWVPIPRAIKYNRLKEWEAFQLANDRFFILIAAMNMKTLALIKIDIYDRTTGDQYRLEKLVPPWSVAIPTTLIDSTIRFRGGVREYVQLTIRNQLCDERFQIQFEVGPGPDRPSIQGIFTGLATQTKPIVAVIPFAENRGMYSHKELMPLVGKLRIGQQWHSFSPHASVLVTDDHKGYYPYIMQWHWVVGGGVDAGGQLVGFNLTANQSRDAERYNENAFWLDGKLHLLPAVEFAIDGEPGTTPWRIRDTGGTGAVDLTFEPVVDNRMVMNALVVESRYRGPYGRFHGTLRSPSTDAALTLDGMFGMGEVFWLRC